MNRCDLVAAKSGNASIFVQIRDVQIRLKKTAICTNHGAFTAIRIGPVDGRKDWHPNKLSIRSRLGDPVRWSNPLDDQTRKNRRLCEEALGFGTAKAVVTSGAVTVHASTLLDSLAGVGGWSVTNVAALPFCASSSRLRLACKHPLKSSAQPAPV